ncbi:MAG: hypothetical protein KDC87_22145 [Planctomycetes bacterium]|nr:hypothetical protein [Planctomycetota bacterium]
MNDPTDIFWSRLRRALFGAADRPLTPEQAEAWMSRPGDDPLSDQMIARIVTRATRYAHGSEDRPWTRGMLRPWFAAVAAAMLLSVALLAAGPKLFWRDGQWASRSLAVDEAVTAMRDARRPTDTRLEAVVHVSRQVLRGIKALGSVREPVGRRLALVHLRALRGSMDLPLGAMPWHVNRIPLAELARQCAGPNRGSAGAESLAAIDRIGFFVRDAVHSLMHLHAGNAGDLATNLDAMLRLVRRRLDALVAPAPGR